MYRLFITEVKSLKRRGHFRLTLLEKYLHFSFITHSSIHLCTVFRLNHLNYSVKVSVNLPQHALATLQHARKFLIRPYVQLQKISPAVLLLVSHSPSCCSTTTRILGGNLNFKTSELLFYFDTCTCNWFTCNRACSFVYRPCQVR